MVKYQKFSRRKFLKRSGAIAAVPSGVGNFSKEREEKLPELVNRNGVVRYMTVPKKWAQHKERSKSVKENLENGLSNKEGIKTIGMERAPEKHGNKNGFQIKIGIDKDQINIEIPDTIDGIPIRTEQYRPSVEIGFCHNILYSGLPPGVSIWDHEYLAEAGTTGWPVRNSNYTGEYMLTAHHVVESGDGDVYGDGGSSVVGNYYESDSNLDATLIETSRNISTTIQGDGNTYPIGGWISESGIESRVSDYFDGYRKMGSTTGETTGGLTDCHVTGNKHSWYGEGVVGTATAAPGDSGGPAFDLANGEAYLSYLVTEAVPNTEVSGSNCRDAQEYNKSMGVAAYELDKHYWTIHS